jgi:hypothetical protein
MFSHLGRQRRGPGAISPALLASAVLTHERTARLLHPTDFVTIVRLAHLAKLSDIVR